ncbi:hypothetical protein CU098_012166 [Rhizopus stolonifer]|uniref:Uncharacterized protein n=1 Tax=Rhizopus stolonifer TaxID=4846 RepID=A0A367KHS1_RHIST|nr:hypothetical protein CU098_012166 [Rhizopus stolonifer]
MWCPQEVFMVPPRGFYGAPDEFRLLFAIWSDCKKPYGTRTSILEDFQNSNSLHY